ncbi:Uncharacterized membrane protein YcaP, DUF421 family [Thermosyntropha lipolytica DSM 11003]|uniref:Uncharacterized membrane protein YcaP, DUF421 family n=1 Tax=Thermosyntropha lipolytica DSM 11003 TaxID=1123382 RepID=A0A1M5K6Y4_9FIRM|nr:DUF421 domain-containing protein [Thermosyntropha lipolytica]SHG48572.1 Uncharacterized membrane protein YcaP, DUF421 family [Thermosyntropha lipolytica DSM 11003]
MLSFVLKAAIMYFMALIMIRLLGKRALGELGPFDFVVMTGVGHTVVSVALDKSIPFYEGVVILFTLALLEYMVGYAALKNQKLSHIITGKPVILIDNGRIIKENLRREKFNIDDLMQELRKQGIKNIDEVEKGILEPCGGFSVLLKDEDEPVSRRDLGIKEARRRDIPTFGEFSRGELFALLEEEEKEVRPEIKLHEFLDKILLKLENIEERLYRLESKSEDGKNRIDAVIKTNDKGRIEDETAPDI